MLGRDKVPHANCVSHNYFQSMRSTARGDHEVCLQVPKPALVRRGMVTSNLLAITECRFHLAERREDGSTVSLQLHVG